MAKTASKTRESRQRGKGPRVVARLRLKKYVYFFGNGKADGNRTMKDTLGGKGAGLAEMTKPACRCRQGSRFRPTRATSITELGQKLTPAIEHEIADNLKKLEKAAGATLGSATNPLLVSVRSGAKFSMPGMMDTILNLGLNDATVEGLKKRTHNGRFAFDSYRRFIQMFGSVVLEIPKAAFEHEFEAVQAGASAALDTDLDEDALARRRHPLQDGRPGAQQEATSRRIRPSSCAARAMPCSARGTTRARRNTAASTTSRTRSAPPSTCR